MMKYVYGWLPIGQKRLEIDPESTDCCPSCTKTETHDHLLRCTHPERASSQLDFINRWREKSVKLKMPEPESAIIAQCLEKWMENGISTAPITTSIYSNKLLQAITDQNRIGWQHFLRGRIASSFQLIVNKNRECTLSPYESNKWTIEIIREIWLFVSDTWTTRNKQLHGETKEENRVIVQQQLMESAKRLYEQKEELSPIDQKNIFPPWHKIEKKTTANLKMWIMTVKQTVNILLDGSKQADDDPNNLDQVS
jgi:hypothetical protein